MRCFDWDGRLIDYDHMLFKVEQENVAQCGPNEFVVCCSPRYPELSAYNSNVEILREADCSKYFSRICCNSEFVFGLWQWCDDDDDDDEKEEQYSRIQVCHLDTLKEAFGLRVPSKYTIERIMTDEHHVVALSRLDNSDLESCQLFMSIFDLPTCNESGDDGKTARFFLFERHIDLTIKPLSLSNVFLLDSWLVVPLNGELVWFDKKEGKRSETSTVLDTCNLDAIYSSGSSLVFALLDRSKFLLKLLCYDCDSK